MGGAQEGFTGPQDTGQKPEKVLSTGCVACGRVRGEAGQDQGLIGRAGLGLWGCGKVSEPGRVGLKRTESEVLSKSHPMRVSHTAWE